MANGPASVLALLLVTAIDDGTLELQDLSYADFGSGPLQAR